MYIILFPFLAVYCNLTVPESPEGSVEAVHNAEELAANDTDWNSYLKIVTFTCPEGSVMEFPNEVNYNFLCCLHSISTI